ncbi:bifunctional metallophosphatase/5'-nucleotidase [Bacillus massiliglaciei]|uniref:bifunctional metallophosphatase/5'-nucleotidase n=1 Tax=Bacillus massiliglaciei TaxID=1816693 RepID=UPI000A7BCBED|nr:bifunctional UDP-sugar hydrolase/5'-nucleotidase [Bacillus massiliglaciei]
MEEIIHLYHTNDLHSHFENWPRIREFLKERKKLHKETGEEAIIVDIGDHVDRWHPYSEGTLGKINVELLNEAGYQYVTIGNNEGITLPHEALDSLYENADFKVLAANLYNVNGVRPDWAQPYWIHKTEKGTKIAIIGLTAYFQKFYSALDWEIREPFGELHTQLDEIKKKADMIVILSHLGIHDDEKMAEDFPEVDVILGGHTHHVLHQGKMVKNSLIGGAGKHGFFVGQAEIQRDSAGKITKRNAYLYDTNELPESKSEKEWIDGMYQTGRKKLQQEVLVLPCDLESDWFESKELSRLLCEALREWTNADCAFVNAGLLLEGLKKGPVTIGDIHYILPHPINPCIVKLSGTELKEILLQSRDSDWPHMQVKGFGFRGKVMGMMVYDRIGFVETPEGIVKQIMIDGIELDPKKRYRLAIPDMFTFGYFFPQIQRSVQKEYMMPEFLRDILLWKLKKVYAVSR